MKTKESAATARSRIGLGLLINDKGLAYGRPNLELIKHQLRKRIRISVPKTHLTTETLQQDGMRVYRFVGAGSSSAGFKAMVPRTVSPAEFTSFCTRPACASIPAREDQSVTVITVPGASAVSERLRPQPASVNWAGLGAISPGQRHGANSQRTGAEAQNAAQATVHANPH